MGPPNDNIMETKKTSRYLNHLISIEPEYDENTNLNKDSQEIIILNETQNTKEKYNLSNSNIKNSKDELNTELEFGPAIIWQWKRAEKNSPSPPMLKQFFCKAYLCGKLR